jgi:hypothetical protein
MKIKLVTFSDGSFGLRAAGQRLIKQADATGWFHYPSEHWTLETLRSKMPDFYIKHENFIKTHQKGLGLWIWKSAILEYQIKQLEENEIVLILDAGCQINSTKESESRFKDYIDFCNLNDILLMQIPENAFGIDDVSDAAWTKLFVLESLDPYSIHRKTNQIQSGIIFAKKSPKSQKIAERWSFYCQESDYKFIIDPTPTEVQSRNFRQHRWEQSILSLLIKNEEIVPIIDETYFYPKWEEGVSFPIWTMRNRSGGDAYRRNLIDLLKLLAAKIERNLIQIIKNNSF